MDLGANLKLGFIDGSCVKPDVGDTELQRWTRCDYMSTSELWKEIAERYGQSNGPLVYQFQMRECTYDVIEKFMLRDSNSKLIQFLMKLNDECESVRSQVLAMDPLHSVNKAYYIVQQIEKQKQVTNHTFEPSAFFANMDNKGSNNERKKNKGSRVDGKRFCTGCNQEGHTVDQCFEKIRYLDWCKGKKAKKQGRMVANVTAGFDDHFSGDTPFDLNIENEIEMHQGCGFDQKLVVVVSKEVMKMFNGEGGESNASRDYASTSHAVHQKSMAYNPHHNGRVERKHRHLLDTARDLRLQANLPLKF
ncbi:pyridoxal 5'-phosphate synthase-like subunit PDX1.2 [Tanacetum coccineum]